MAGSTSPANRTSRHRRSAGRLHRAAVREQPDHRVRLANNFKQISMQVGQSDDFSVLRRRGQRPAAGQRGVHRHRPGAVQPDPDVRASVANVNALKIQLWIGKKGRVHRACRRRADGSQGRMSGGPPERRGLPTGGRRTRPDRGGPHPDHRGRPGRGGHLRPRPVRSGGRRTDGVASPVHRGGPGTEAHPRARLPRPVARGVGLPERPADEIVPRAPSLEKFGGPAPPRGCWVHGGARGLDVVLASVRDCGACVIDNPVEVAGRRPATGRVQRRRLAAVPGRPAGRLVPCSEEHTGEYIATGEARKATRGVRGPRRRT